MQESYATLVPTMSSAEYEPTQPHDISPIKRYYSDVFYKSNSMGDMIIAAEKLLELNGITLSQDEFTSRSAEVLPLYTDHAINTPEMYDRYLTLPLVLAGPTIDRTWKLQDVRAWYSSTLDHIRTRAAKDTGHSVQCLESASFAYSHACERGLHCPYIFTAKYMERQMFDEYFDLPGYDKDLVIMPQVAIAKERLAQRYVFRTEYQAEVMIRAYDDRVRAEMARRALEG